MTPPASPRRAVLDAVRNGVAPAQIARQTGLDPGLVTLALDRLVASGHLATTPLTGGCPEGAGGCTGCPVPVGCPGVSGPTTSPVLISLAGLA